MKHFKPYDGSHQEAKEYVEQGKWYGVICPTCGQFYKVYKKKFVKTMAIMMISLFRLTMNSNEEYFYIKEICHKNQQINTGTLAQIRFWGLIEEMEKDPDNDKKKTSGYWKITTKGIGFALGNILIPKYILTCNNEFIRFEGDGIDIKKALGKEFEFNYSELMDEYIKKNPPSNQLKLNI